MTFKQTNQTGFRLSAFKLSELNYPLFSFHGIFSLSKSPLSTFKAFQLSESRTGKWKVGKHYPKSVVYIYRALYVALESRTGKWKVEKHYPKSVVFIYRAQYVKFKPCLVRLLERQWSIMKLGWG